MFQEAVLKYLADQIVLRKLDQRPLSVGINGVDASGKTELTRNLAAHLEFASIFHIDDFHNPETRRYQTGAQSPEGYY